ncbi:hypothetical protein [Oceanirhabdus seepicola]|uniref:SipW-cognate class signal peptide n=1 Tax=Oceanirhabdus seepicola TaxID=2828781 RepID=A0A9J6P1D5_9CLOT|nr:hypothetical protein [Oceanirhabdus seepicola]MCM1990228.1 hypothetical protein [Oceanirhabdus seepicola]
MVRRKFIKVTRAALICSTIAASLSVMGVGYAAWNKSVSIIGKISTGSIDVIFNEAYFNNNPNGDKNFDEIHFGNKLNGDIKDTADTQAKKYNDISVEFDSNTILIRGIMYYPNDIVLKYNVVDEGTIPVEMINEGEKKFELENGGFIIINPISETIKVHIPRADGYYTTIAPIEFKSKYGSWKETLFIDLNIFVELPNNEVTTSSAISMEVTTSSAISMDISDNSRFNDSIDALSGEIEVIISEDESEDYNLIEDNEIDIEEESEANDQTQDNGSELEERNETLDDLSDAIIVESESNNEVEEDSSQIEEETDNEIEDNEIDIEEQSEADDQSQDNDPKVEENDSNTEPGEEVDVNDQQPEEETQTETEKILEALEKLSDAIIVDSKDNNEVDSK